MKSARPLARDRAATASVWSTFLPLLPFMLAVFAGYGAMGMALSVVPRQVHGPLGQGTTMVGTVMGVQYAAAIFARAWAGGTVDTRGPRLAACCGLLAAVGVGAIYLASALLVDAPRLALALVFAGRLLSGVTEAFVLTSTMAWALMRMGPAYAGMVFGWIGVALFGGFAVGSPLGSALYGAYGFAGVGSAMMLAGLAGLVGTRCIADVPPARVARLPFTRVLGAIRGPGVALMLASAGYAMIAAFAVLLFAQRGWGGGALALTCMGIGFIFCRLLLGHLPDLKGGARVALVATLIEALGLALIWAAPLPALAWLGAALVGGSYSLVFQGLGIVAVQRTPPQSRGSAMGAYVIFQDLAMGLAPPLAGGLAQLAGLDAVYLAAAITALGASGVAWSLVREPTAAVAA